MPQTIVREFDETKQATSTYSNFTVVVPGFIGIRDTTLRAAYNDIELAGETDGIYEISSEKEFRGIIGFCNAEGIDVTQETIATAADPEDYTWYYGTDEGESETAKLGSLLNAGALITLEQEADDSTGTDTFKVYVATVQEDSGAEDGELKATGLKPAGDTTTANYKFTEIHDYVADGGELAFVGDDTPTLFAVIKDSKTGNQEVAAQTIHVPTQRGNQIAYELVKAGYTILYVSLGNWSDMLTDGAVDGAKLKTAIEQLKYSELWEPLKDRTAYDFRYVISGLYADSDMKDDDGFKAAVDGQLGTLVSFLHDGLTNDADSDYHKGRGDCIALFDIPEDIYEANGRKQAAAITAITNYVNTNYTVLNDKENDIYGKYCAIFAPEVQYNMSTSDCSIEINGTNYTYTYQTVNTDGETVSQNQVNFPASLHYLLCAAYSRENNIAEYWANAGETRGICKYRVTATSVKFGEVGINTLEPRYLINKTTTIQRAVNPVALIHGTYYLYGARTAYAVSEDEATNLKASHFLNIRELCTTLKKLTYKASFVYRFDPNSDLLWVKFCNYLRPTLEAMKGNQGILAYKFEQLTTSKKAKLRGKIRIVPVEPVEDFDLGLYLEDSVDGEVASLFED